MTPIHFDPTQASEIAEGILETPLSGLYFLPIQIHQDERGFFTELAKIPQLVAIKPDGFGIKQMNLSYSKQNVARGFHAENWNKLVTVLSGTSFCAWADLRPDSATFGQVVTLNLGDGPNAHQGVVYIEKGIANSLLVTQGPSHYLYAVDQLYSQRDTAADVAISLFDPDLNVTWPINQAEMIYSQRDVDTISLRAKFPEKF